MTEDNRQWFLERGIELDDDGVPVMYATDRPPEPCLRCGAIVEGPNEAVFGGPAGFHRGTLCVDCFRLMLTAPLEFWNGSVNEADHALRRTAVLLAAGRILGLAMIVIFALLWVWLWSNF